MAFVDIQILGQGLLYVCLFILGFCVAVPIGVSSGTAKRCLLYQDVTWSNNRVLTLEVQPSSPCQFPMYIGVFGLVIYGLIGGLYHGYAVLKSRSVPDQGSKMWAWPPLIINSLVCFLTLVAACMISVGLKHFCDGLTKDNGFAACADAQDIDLKPEGSLGSFHSLLHTAEVTAWLSFLCLLVLSGLYGLRIYRNRRALRKQSSQSDQTNAAGIDSPSTDKF